MSEPVSAKPSDTASSDDLTRVSPTANEKRFAVRLSLMVVVPLLIGGFLFTWLLANHEHARSKEQGELIGQAIADQLAISLADHLVNEDALSLNVVLSELLVRGNFDFASVYSADNRLLAQSGRRKENGNQIVFTRDITFQNATVGYVQIGFEEQSLVRSARLLMLIGIVLFTVTAALCTVLIFRYKTVIRAWLDDDLDDATAPPPSPAGDTATEDTEINTEVTEIKTVCVLVLRIRPRRLTGDYRDRIARALSLYGGVITNPEGDDISAIFSARDQVFQAICGGLLVKSMIDRIGPPLTFNAGIHSAPANDFTMAQKHASYLASIAEDWLLTSQRIHDEVSENNTVLMQEFHSSLTPDGEVYSVVSLTAPNQSLIDRQADRLI